MKLAVLEMLLNITGSIFNLEAIWRLVCDDLDVQFAHFGAYAFNLLQPKLCTDRWDTAMKILYIMMLNKKESDLVFFTVS